MSQQRGRGRLRGSSMAVVLARSLLRPGPAGPCRGGLLSGLRAALARLSASTAKLYAQTEAAPSGSAGRIGAGLKGTIDCSDQSLGTVLGKLNGSYLDPTPGTTHFSAYLESGGQQRRQVVIQPTVAVPGAPVLMLRHPHGVTPETMGNLTRAGRLSAEYGAWNSDPKDSGADNIGFLSQLAAVAVDTYKLDRKHLYFAGYSSGGFMSECMACKRSAILAGIGVVAATMQPDVATSCQLTQPIPVALMNGTADPIVLCNGYIGDNSLRSAPETAAIWAQQDSCDPTAIQTATLPNEERPISQTTVVRSTFTARPAGAAIRFYTIDKGGLPGPAPKTTFTPRRWARPATISTRPRRCGRS